SCAATGSCYGARKSRGVKLQQKFGKAPDKFQFTGVRLKQFILFGTITRDLFRSQFAEKIPKYFFAFCPFLHKRKLSVTDYLASRAQKRFPCLHVRRMAIHDDSIEVKDDAANHSRPIDLEQLI